MPMVDEPPTSVPTMLPATNNELARAPPIVKSRPSFTLQMDHMLAAITVPNVRKTPRISVVLNVSFTLPTKSYCNKEKPCKEFSPGLFSLPFLLTALDFRKLLFGVLLITHQRKSLLLTCVHRKKPNTDDNGCKAN